ncbi:MAG: hypothetical protein IJF65_03325 [Clostridia bacterium]|nr:hypothetical protein [Clostridia bacterium]
MKESGQTSPFAALTLKEQQEKWIAWQSQHLEHRPLERPVEASPSPVELPRPQAPKAPNPEHSHAPEAFPPPRHRQYDAVLKRMNDASKKARHWQPIT